MTQLAQSYGVSSSYLARVCKRLNIPRPGLGYWAKLAAGKKVKQRPLPKPQTGDELAWARAGELPVNKPVITPPTAIRTRPLGKNKVSKVHRLIRDARPLFLKGRKTDNGYLKPRKWHLVDIVVSGPGLDRALEIMNAVFLLLERYEHRVRLSPSHETFHRHDVDIKEKPRHQNSHITHWHPGRETVAYIGSVAIGITLYEISEAVEVIYHHGDYVPIANVGSDWESKYPRAWSTTKEYPSGRFCLQAYSPYQGTSWVHQWEIDKNTSLDRLANKVVKHLHGQVTLIAELALKAEQEAKRMMAQRAKEFKAWEKEQAERQQAKAHEESMKDLNDIIAHWAEMKNIAAFFKEAEEAVHRLPESERQALGQRIQEAKNMMGEHNALQELRSWRSSEEKLNIYSVKS